MRITPAVVLVLVGLAACSDPPCPTNQKKIGSSCQELVSAPDSSTATEDDPSTGMRGVDRDAAKPNDVALDGSEDIPESADARPDDAATTGSQTAPSDTANGGCLSDLDGDGFGVGPATASCPLMGDPPAAGDCNDGNPQVHPGLAEVCGDGLDNDCNGKVDDGTPEQCNGIDDDCNPQTPDGVGACGLFVCRDAKCLTSCTSSADCAMGLECLAGSCQDDNDGAACESDEHCTSGACQPDKFCGPKRLPGAPCDSPGDCAVGAICTTYIAYTICKLDVGSDCSDNSDCASQACYKKCLPGLSPFNGPCDEHADCRAGLNCNAENVCKTAIGSGCDTDSDCAIPFCRTGGCKQPIGFRCQNDSDCFQGHRCEGSSGCRPTEGVACRFYDDCFSGFKCHNMTCKPVP